MSHDNFSKVTPLGDNLNRLDQVLQATNTIIWELNLEERTVEYFGSVEQVLGVSIPELNEPIASIEKIVHPEDLANISDQVDSVVHGNVESLEMEYRTHPDHGQIRWIRTEAFVEEKEDDASPVLIGMSTDITEQKEYQARLESFASVLTHDLRNPLSVAKGRLELARAETPSDHLDEIATALDRMGMLIDDLLSLTRDDQTIGELETVDLAGLAEDCWRTVETREATLTVNVDQMILADKSRLKQVLENLFRNAIEHGGGDVTVTIGDMKDGFSVEDDGRGIPPDLRVQLFEGMTTFGRSGIGLSIVKQIVDAHDWEIRVTEGESRGARFEITGIQPA